MDGRLASAGLADAELDSALAALRLRLWLAFAYDDALRAIDRALVELCRRESVLRAVV